MKEMAPSSSTFAGNFHGQRSLVGYSTWGKKESDMIEHSAQWHNIYNIPCFL